MSKTSASFHQQGSVSPAPPGSAGAARRQAAPSKTPSRTLLVHVAGLVTTPGVYELADGSRVKDAVAAAGGPKPGADIDALNLAAVLSDGQKILVGAPGQALAEPATSNFGGPAAGPTPAAKVNLNAATQAELESLPSIGPVMAQRILSLRQQKGKFTSIKQLQDVPGVGPKKFEALKDLVTV